MTYYRYSFGTLDNPYYYLFTGSVSLFSYIVLPKNINIICGSGYTLISIFWLTFCTYNRQKYIRQFKKLTGKNMYIREEYIHWITPIYPYGITVHSCRVEENNGRTQTYLIDKIDKMIDIEKKKNILLFANHKCPDSLIYKDKVPREIITEIIKNID